ncbi:MAG: GHMP kinase [Calditrichaeota bacterium]|nr:MAG: GHMP kinase [Calditrichota bacterium]
MIITQTPLRVSFAGGGTDLQAFYGLHEGAVVSTAIDKYVFLIVKERFDSKIYLNYSTKEIVDSVDEIQHDIFREALRLVGVESGVEITSLADIPSSGSGLGSSSSFTVGLLNALYVYANNPQPAERLAQDACKIEIEILGKPIGKQDQYIAAYGGLRKFTFKKDETVENRLINLNNEEKRRFGSQIQLFFTDITRKADAILSEQKRTTVNKQDALLEMKNQVDKIVESLENDNFHEVGKILHSGWELKKSLASKISNPSINEMYQIARDFGAIGGKICGAGGGGFLLTSCSREKQTNLRKGLKDFKEMPFMLEDSGSKVIFNIARYTWK